MWVHDYKSERDNPYRMPPFLEITHMSHVDNLPRWTYSWHEHPEEYTGPTADMWTACSNPCAWAFFS